MTWTPDYKKDSNRIKKFRNEISRDKKVSLLDHDETDVGDVKPSQRIKELQTKLHGISQPRGIYKDLFLELAELSIEGMIDPGQQRDIGNSMLTKLRKKGFKISEE